MSNENELKSDNELLEIVVEGLAGLRIGQRDLLTRLGELEAASKIRSEKARGDNLALSGKIDGLAGEVKGLSGNIVVLDASVDALNQGHDEFRRTLRGFNQSLDGLTQLSKTNYDQNASILEELTGVKGADRPQRKTRPSEG